MFCEKGILKKFSDIHRKTPVLQSLFNKDAGLKACIFNKKRLQHRFFFCEHWESFKNNYSEVDLRAAASVCSYSKLELASEL